MLIIGAKGFAKEVYEVILQKKADKSSIAFYDDITSDLGSHLFGLPIITHEEGAKQFFRIEGKSFILGIGGVFNRNKLLEKFIRLGGEPKTLISPYVQIGKNDNFIGKGTCIMTGSVLTSSIKVGKGCLINLNCTIGHDVNVGDYCELSPTVNISGRCKVGKFVTFGTNATILPDINIGNNAIIGAGAVINKDVPDNAVVVGVPGKIVKYNDPLNF